MFWDVDLFSVEGLDEVAWFGVLEHFDAVGGVFYT